MGEESMELEEPGEDEEDEDDFFNPDKDEDEGRFEEDDF
jgi:hypothetical protein